MNYDVVIFDADETLFDFKKSEKAAFYNTMQQFQFEYDEAVHLKLYSKINERIWKEFEQGLITQEVLKVERFRRFSEALGVHFDAMAFAKAFMKHLSQASYLYAESTDLVEALSQKYSLVMITNGLTEVQDTRIRKSSIAKYFKNIVISEEVKVSKPDPEIFEIALNNIHHSNKNRVLMVGDSLSSDIKGGVAFGIDTCWYNPNQLENKSGLTPTYEISKLEELKHLLLI